MGSIAVSLEAQDNRRQRASTINALGRYLKSYCSGLMILGIVGEVNEGSIIDILRRPRFTGEFLEELFKYSYSGDFWFLSAIDLKPIHHGFIRVYIMDLFG